MNERVPHDGNKIDMLLGYVDTSFLFLSSLTFFFHLTSFLFPLSLYEILPTLVQGFEVRQVPTGTNSESCSSRFSR